MMTTRVIFLDIDGVLLPFPTLQPNKLSGLFPATTLRPLQRLWKHVNQTGPVEWVLSSTWRVQRSVVRDVENTLQEFGIPIEFSDTTDPAMHTERQWEIYDWLANKRDLLDKPCVWLALDDEELLEGDKNAKHRSIFQGHVIGTRSRLGLIDSDVDRAIELWDQQIEKYNKES